MNNMKKIFLSYSKIAGVTHKNADGTDRQKIIKKCKESDVLQLQREPNNQYDEKAIAIYQKKYQIGYVTKNFSETLSPLMDNGSELFAEISEITGGGQTDYGCNIKIFAKSLVSRFRSSKSSNNVDIKVLNDDENPYQINIYKKLGVLDRDLAKFIYNEKNEGLHLNVAVSKVVDSHIIPTKNTTLIRTISLL